MQEFKIIKYKYLTGFNDSFSYFFSLYTLIFALFAKTDGMISALKKLEEMRNEGANFGLDAPTLATQPPKDCFQVPIPCELLSK